MKLLNFLLIAICLYGCKKNKNDNNLNEGTILIKTSHQQVGTPRITLYNRTNSDILNSIQYTLSSFPHSYILEYSSDGKLLKESALNSNAQVGYYDTFFYGTGNKILKKNRHKGFVDINEEIHSYGYDLSGKLINDTLFVPTGNGYIVFGLINFYYSGNNITEVESFSGNKLEWNERIKYEYDNAKNPYYDIPNLYQINDGSSIFTVVYNSKNNVIKEYAADNNGIYKLLQTNDYVYNSNNFPSKYSFKYTDTGAGDSGTVEFFYK